MGHPHGDNAHDGHLAQDVENVVPHQEAWRQDGKSENQQQENEDDSIASGVASAPPM